MLGTKLYKIIGVIMAIAVSLTGVASANAQISTGGAYGMEQSVTASGGGSSNAIL